MANPIELDLIRVAAQEPDDLDSRPPAPRDQETLALSDHLPITSVLAVLVNLEQALIKANERNTVWEQIQVHHFLGRIHFEHKKYDLAKTHLEQSVRIGRAADNKIYDAQATDVLEQIAEIQDAD